MPRNALNDLNLANYPGEVPNLNTRNSMVYMLGVEKNHGQTMKEMLICLQIWCTKLHVCGLFLPHRSLKFLFISCIRCTNILKI